VARDFFAKLWKLFDKTRTSAPKQPGKLSRLPLQVRLELIPGENFVAATRRSPEWARVAIGGATSADADLQFAAVFAVARP
jgi:hypothetical protein